MHERVFAFLLATDIMFVCGSHVSGNRSCAADSINRELKQQKLPEAKILEAPKAQLSNPMDPAMWMLIHVGSPIIAFFFCVCSCVWLSTYFRTRQMKIGQEIVEDLVLKKLPMPTVEEVGAEVVTERDLMKQIESGAVLTVDEQIEQKYEVEAIEKAKKSRSTKKGDKIAYNLDDFHYRDAGKEIPDTVVSAFLTTGKFEATSDTTGDVGILQTYQRLEKFRSGADDEEGDMDALWKDKDRVKDLIKAGARVPKSKTRPLSVAGPMPTVQGSRELKQQVAAQHKQVSALGGRSMPEFIRDKQMDTYQKHPEPLKLGVDRIEAAAARGPRNRNVDDDEVKLIENGNGHANGSGRPKSSSRLLAILPGLGNRKSKDGKGKDDGDGLEVMV